MVRDTDLTDEEIRAFQDEYGPALGDPFVANALMETVSARELYAFAERVGVSSPYSTAGRARADILYELGEVLVLSTGGVNLGSAAQAGFDQVRGDLRGAHGETMDELAAYRVAEYQEAGIRPGAPDPGLLPVLPAHGGRGPEEPGPGPGGRVLPGT